LGVGELLTDHLRERRRMAETWEEVTETRWVWEEGTWQKRGRNIMMGGRHG